MSRKGSWSGAGVMSKLHNAFTKKVRRENKLNNRARIAKVFSKK